MGGRSFPTLLWLAADGTKLAEQGDRSVDGFRATGQALVKLQQLGDKKDRTAAEDVEYFLARVDLGQLDFAKAKEEAAGLKAYGEMQKRIDAALLDLEIGDVMSGVRSQEQAIEAGKTFAGMIEAGRMPTKKGIPTAQFWMMTSEHAKDSEDAELFERCLNGVKDALDNDKRYQRVFDNLQKQLDELKK